MSSVRPAYYLEQGGELNQEPININGRSRVRPMKFRFYMKTISFSGLDAMQNWNPDLHYHREKQVDLLIRGGIILCLVVRELHSLDTYINIFA